MQWDLHGSQHDPFSIPFELSAHDGKLWIAPYYKAAIGEWQRLHIKGTNWAGFQASGCPHILWDGQKVSEYIDFLTEHKFNAVRLPLSAYRIYTNEANTIEPYGQCGPYYWRWQHLDILDDVIAQLRAAGIFVTLDMHNLYGDGNDGAWCGGAEADCNLYGGSMADTLVPRAWEILARRYCRQPNVIIADLFNEPFGHSWEGWRAFVQVTGARVLQLCPRWLIMAEGVAGGGYWWGENIAMQVTTPIVLPVPNKLILSPHAYGHGKKTTRASHAQSASRTPTACRALFSL